MKKREREPLTQQLQQAQQAQQAARPVDVSAEVDRPASKAWALIDELQQADPASVCQLLRLAIDPIELSCTAS